VLFALSLFKDGYFVERGDSITSAGSAWLLLLIGWMGLFLGIIAWLANPLLLVGWLLLAGRQPRAAAVCALAATVCAGSFLFYKTMITDEAGHRSRITGYGLGYWLWLGSAAVLVAASLVAVFGSRDHDESESVKPDRDSVVKKSGACEFSSLEHAHLRMGCLTSPSSKTPVTKTRIRRTP
jgi:hypothetical protein